MTGLDWLGGAVTSAGVDALLKVMGRRDFARELERRIRRHDDIELRWVERILLRRMIRRSTTWPLLFDIRSQARQELAAAAAQVLVPHDRGPARAAAIADAMQTEFFGALESQDAFVALGAHIRSTAHDVRELVARTRPRDPNPALDAFLELEEFYAPTLADGRRFDHRSTLVGRDRELAEVSAALGPEAGKKLVILSAPAGAGKSRLALEVLRTLQAAGVRPVRVMVRAEGREVDDNALGRLPPRPLILVVEDAHRDAEGLAAVLQYARRRDDVGVLVTARGDAMPELTSALRAHFDATEIDIVKLGALSASAARRLVTELQGDDVSLTAAGAETLSQSARNTPLIAVLAISMIRTGELAASLTVDPEIRRHVMSTYGEVTTAGLVGVPAERARNIIAVIAALGTLDVADHAEIDAVAAFLGTDRLSLLTDLDRLISAGTVVGRRKRLRVVPDVLADEVLAARSVAAGVDTGFVSRLWVSFASTRAQDLVRNFAELGWRVAALAGPEDSSGAPDVFAPVWVEVHAQVVAAGNAGRCAGLATLEAVAMLQPQRVLDLVGELLDRPKPEPERGTFVEYTHTDVQRAAAPLLRTCGVAAPQRLPEVLDRLWHLAQVDTRPPNQDGNHPMRLLEELADLGNSGSSTTDAVLQAVERWLDAPDLPDSPRTPLTLLKMLVAKSGYTMDPGRRSIAMHPYLIAPVKVRSIRDRVRSLASRVAREDSIRRATDAVDILCTALHEPVGYFGQSVPEEVVLSWEEDDLATLAALRAIAETAKDPLPRLRMRDQLDWQARYAHSPVIRQTAAELATSVDNHLEDLLTDVLRGGWSTASARGARATLTDPHAYPSPTAEAHSQTADESMDAARDHLAERDRRQQAELRHVTAELRGQTLPNALGAVAARVNVLHQCEPDRSPTGVEDVIRGLCRARPTEIQSAVEWVMSGGGVLDPWVRALADELASADVDAFLAVLPVLMMRRTELTAALLTGFSWHRWGTRFPDAIPVLVDALEHPDPAIQAAAWTGAADLLEADVLSWAPRFAEAASRHPGAVSVAVAGAARRGGHGWVSSMSHLERSALLRVVGALPEWEYPIQKLLSGLAAQLPGPVLDMISVRGLRPSEELRGIHGLAQAISEHPRDLLDWVRQAARQSEEDQFDLGRIWAAVAGRPLTPGARSVVTAVIQGGSDTEVEFVAAGIGHDDGFTVREIALTSELVDRISTLGEATSARCLAHLRRSFHPRAYGRRPGEPSEDRVSRRDAALSAAEQGTLSACAREFYAEAAAREQALIDDDLRRDAEEDEDG